MTRKTKQLVLAGAFDVVCWTLLILFITHVL